MARPRGRSPKGQTDLANEPKKDWRDGLLAAQPEPGDQIKAAAEELLMPPGAVLDVTVEEEKDGSTTITAYQQPHLPGQEPTLRDRVLFALKDWEKELALIDSREEKQQEKNDLERRVIWREADLLQRLLEALPEQAPTPADLPPSQADDLAALQADVQAAGLTWENFQRDVLKWVCFEWGRDALLVEEGAEATVGQSHTAKLMNLSKDGP